MHERKRLKITPEESHSSASLLNYTQVEPPNIQAITVEAGSEVTYMIHTQPALTTECLCVLHSVNAFARRTPLAAAVQAEAFLGKIYLH